MAYAPNEELDPTTGLPIQQTGDGGTISGGGSSPGGPAPKSPAQSNPGAFVGIQQYLDANKPQSQKLAQSVGGEVTGLGDTARGAIAQGQNSFNQDVNAGTTSFDSDLGNRVQNNAETLNDADKTKFKQEQGAQYSGPNSFQEAAYYQPTQNAVNAANQAAANTKTDEGQRQLLNPLENKAKHGTSQGIGTFDTALLQSAPNARTELANARQSVSDIDPKLQQAISNALSGATAAKTTTQNTAASAKQALQSGVGTLNTALPQKYNQFTTDADAYNKNLTKLGSQLGYNPQDTNDYTELYKTLGITPDQPLYGTRDFQNYLKAPAPTSLSQFASPEEAARYAALQDLGGQFDFNLDPTQAGTAGTGHDTADTAGLKKALSDNEADWTKRIAGSIGVPAQLDDKGNATNMDPLNQEVKNGQLPVGPIVISPDAPMGTTARPVTSGIDTGPGIAQATGLASPATAQPTPIEPTPAPVFNNANGTPGYVSPNIPTTPPKTNTINAPINPNTVSKGKTANQTLEASLTPASQAKINWGPTLPKDLNPASWKYMGNGTWMFTGPQKAVNTGTVPAAGPQWNHTF